MFNIIDIIVVLVIIIAVFLGYKKGFVKTIVNLLSFFVAIGLALTFYKPVAVILTENTTIDDWIVENIMAKNEEEDQIESEEKVDTESLESNNETEKEVSGVQSFLQVAENLPVTIVNNFELEEIKNNTKQEIAYKVSELIMNLVSLILIYVIVKITLAIASFILDGIMKCPVLKQLNEILGMAIGAVIGFLQVYLAFAVITFISSICDIAVVIETIKVSAFASRLFENNLIINLLF